MFFAADAAEKKEGTDMNTSVVEQLRSVVEDSGVLSQLAAEEVELVGWLSVHLVMFVLVVLALPASLRRVDRYFNVAKGGLDDEVHKWRMFLWILALLLGLLLAVIVVCEAVTLYQYCTYPKAMVLRDILRRI